MKCWCHCGIVVVKREVKCWCHCGIVVVKRDEVLVSLWDCGGEERCGSSAAMGWY